MTAANSENATECRSHDAPMVTVPARLRLRLGAIGKLTAAFLRAATAVSGGWDLCRRAAIFWAGGSALASEAGEADAAVECALLPTPLRMVEQ